jgi:excisionase family DNA binding protein
LEENAVTHSLSVSDSTIPKLYAPIQVAELLGVSLRTVRNWIAAGDLAHTRLGAGKRLIRVREDDLMAFLDRRYQESVDKEARDDGR